MKKSELGGVRNGAVANGDSTTMIRMSTNRAAATGTDARTAAKQERLRHLPPRGVAFRCALSEDIF